MTALKALSLWLERLTPTRVIFLSLFFVGLTVSAFVAHLFHTHSENAWSGLSQRKNFTLERNWIVYRNSVVPVSDFSHQNCLLNKAHSSGESISLPDVWGPAITPDVTTGHGVATYCAEVSLPESQTQFGIKIGTIRSVYKIYAISDDSPDGRKSRVTLLYSNGDPSRAKDIVAESPVVPVLAFPQDLRHFQLVIQLANYVHKQGGLLDVPEIGDLQYLNSLELRETVFPTALVLVLLTISILTFAVGSLFDKSKGHIIFSVLAASAALRTFLVSNIIWLYIPNFSEARKYDLEYLSLFVATTAYYALICYLIRGAKVLRVDKMVYLISAGLSVFALFIAPLLPPGTITLLREPFELLWGCICALLSASIVRALLFREVEMRGALVMLLAALSTFAYEILSSIKVIHSFMGMSNVFIVFAAFIYTLNFVLKFRDGQRDLNNLSRDLSASNEILKERTEELCSALRLAESASEAKSEFIAAMSHELRTPLNAVIGFSEIMVKESFGPLGHKNYSDYICDINEAGARLLDMVNDILEASNAETDDHASMNDRVAVEEVAAQVLADSKKSANKMGIQCSLNLDENLPAILGNKAQIRKILSHLVSNAIKFNVINGTLQVDVFCQAGGLFIRVRDSGMGIPEEEIPNVLNKFTQIDGGLGRKHGGLGLGLTTARNLVNKHGGKLMIESSVNIGTTATVILPIERCVFPAMDVGRPSLSVA